MVEYLSFWVVFGFTVIGFGYSLVKGSGPWKLVTAVAVIASAELLTNAASLSGFGWVVDILVSAGLVLTARRKARSAILSGVSKTEVGFGAVVLYGVLVTILGVVLYPTNSIIRLACLLLVYVVGARVIGGSAAIDIESPSAARAVIFAGWIFPGAVLVAVTALSGLLGFGSDARFDAHTPVHVGSFSTPRLMNSALGPTFVGHTSLVVLIVITFAFFRTRSTALRVLAICAWGGYSAVLVWSGTRTALLAGWIGCCGTLLLFGLVSQRRYVRRRAMCALAVAVISALVGMDVISRFLNRSADGTLLDVSQLYQSGRGKYTDNVFRWIGYGSHDAVWGAGLGANTAVTKSIMNVSTIERDTAYGLIEPFFELILFEWGVVGGVGYAAYWLWLSWIVVRGDLRDLRRGIPWAGLATCWLLYVWATTVTSFGFGIVNNTLLMMFGLTRLVTGRRRNTPPDRAPRIANIRAAYDQVGT